MKKIFFVGNVGKNSTFIDNDYRELKKHFLVKYTPMQLYFKLNILKTFKNVLWCDTVYGWFASWRMIIPTIFAKILNKKIVVVAGGYDVVDAPEINYGAFARLPDRRISKFVFKHADLVLPVSRYMKNDLLEKMPVKEIQVVYNGVNIKKFYPQGAKDNNLVITVGEIIWRNLKRKGIEDFVRTAKYLPSVKFVVIGKHKDDSIDYLKNIASSNVKFTGYVDDEELLKWYQRAKVYAQLSYHEGFGLSVAESMLCECVPVMTNSGALPEVAGHWAYLTSYGLPGMSAAVIKEALKQDKDYGKRFRDRVLFNFSLEERIEKLRRILK